MAMSSGTTPYTTRMVEPATAGGYTEKSLLPYAGSYITCLISPEASVLRQSGVDESMRASVAGVMDRPG